MKKILYIGQYNGIIGGIERYMQKSAELLRKNGFELHYRYIENGGREQEHFALAFDTIKSFTPGDEILQSADMVILHNIIDVKYLEFLPEKRSGFRHIVLGRKPLAQMGRDMGMGINHPNAQWLFLQEAVPEAVRYPVGNAAAACAQDSPVILAVK
jgi:hypothetical protein